MDDAPTPVVGTLPAVERDVARSDEAYLELHDPAGASTSPEIPLRTDTAAPVDDYLEVPEALAVPGSPSQKVLTDDDLRVVAALAEDNRPILACLWPGEPDLASRLPDADSLAERVASARRFINQATRRGSDWRARAELAGATLSRRLSPDGTLDATEAGEALKAWHRTALMHIARADADPQGKLYAAEVRRLDAEARQRGITVGALDGWCAEAGLQRVTGDAGWPPCEALPGAPRTRDAVAEALVTQQAQGVAALAEGAVRAWLAAARAPAELIDTAVEAERLAGDKATALEGLWSMAWALGREGVSVHGLEVGAPEALLAHMRAARLHDSVVTSAAPVLALWFRRRGSIPVAAACEALARGEPHALQRLRWSLGEPLRLGGRALHDPTELAREVVTHAPTRAAALAAWRDGLLSAWLSALPLARRDTLWSDELAQARTGAPPAEVHTDEGTFWRGIYRRAPRAALSVRVSGGTVRFASLADLLVTDSVAAVWEALKALHRNRELLAWLNVAAPGMEIPSPSNTLPGDDLALNTLLWAVGHTGLVLPWAGGGVAIATPGDVVAAWTRSPALLAAPLARGCLTAWLHRFYSDLRAGGVSVGRSLAAFAQAPNGLPDGHASVLLALLCGLQALPADPANPGTGRARRAWVGIDSTPPEGTDRTAAWEPLRAYITSGVALVWAARHAPELGAVLAARVDGADGSDEMVSRLAAVGVPRASAALAGELEGAREVRTREVARVAAMREAAEREAARTIERIAAEREATRLAAQRDALRAEAEAEIAELTARRTEAREAAERELARLKAVREATRLASVRETAERDEARRLEASEAEALGRRLEEEQSAAEKESAQKAAAREATRAASARQGDVEQRVRERRWAHERAAAEAEVSRWKRAFESVLHAGRGEGGDAEDTEDATLAPATPEEVFGAASLRAAAGDDVAGESLPWGDRHEMVVDRLVAAPVDDADRERIVTAVDVWARALPNHPWRDLAARMEVLELTAHPAYEIAVTTRLESRVAGVVGPPWHEDRTVAAPPDVVTTEVATRGCAPTVDPWSVTLPAVDTYGPWNTEYLLDLPPERRPCPDCDATGRATCTRCTGTGTVPCRRCDAKGRARCPDCVGAGAVLTEGGLQRCPRCDGRASVVCDGCTVGRARCKDCARTGRVACTGCGGRGALAERVAVTQSFTSVAAFAVVAEGVPAGVTAAVRSVAAEGRPVIHVEGSDIDPFALAREIPHPEVGAQAAQLLGEEAARGGEGTRATRQRLIVRRYPVWRVTYRTGETVDGLWVHGLRQRVHAEDSPIARYVTGLVTAARDALAQGDIATSTDRLTELVQIDAEHAEGRAVAGALGESVYAMALRGELFAARDAAARAARLRWPECVAHLVKAEQVLSRRLHAPTAWAMLEEASRALDRGRLPRAAERLAALATSEPHHAEGTVLARRLAQGLAALDVTEPENARALAPAVAAVPWGGCPETAAAILRRAARDRWRAGIRQWGPVVIAATVALGLLAHWLAR